MKTKNNTKDCMLVKNENIRINKQNKSLHLQVRLQATVIKIMALKIRENFASDIELNKIIRYYEVLAQKELGPCYET